MPNRPCLNCGQPSPNTRCTSCTRRHKAANHHPRGDLALAGYRRRRAELIRLHLETHGPVCPGWGTRPHPTDPADLTTDHIDPITTGGHPDGPLRVLCRPCNSRAGQATQHGRGGPNP